jgi:hypothetical protein
MKKKLIIGLVTLLSLVLTYGFADAVSGTCVTCHTMHNSQDGVTMGGLNDLLLRNNCLGCHSSTVANETIKTGNIPVVYNTTGYPVGARGSGATAPLAGGNFYTAGGTAPDDAKVHNVTGIAAGADVTLVYVPPGGTDMTVQLTCAGTTGCHGDRSIGTDNAAIKGAHHANVATGLDGTTTAKSYRFLKGVTGVEQAVWEQTASSTAHNGYKAATDSNGTAVDISVLCTGCHTNFHGAVNTGSPTPWQRHPTDIVLTAAVVTGYGGTYLLETPVALATPSTNGSTVDATSRVICMSCHNTHGSTYADMLRFDYSAMNAGSGTNQAGCETCHLAQR